MYDSDGATATHLGPTTIPDTQPARPAIWTVLLFYAAYVAAGMLSNGLSLIPGVTIIFWPPVGIMIATLIQNRKATWPWWIAAGCAAELTCNALHWHNPIEFALLYFSGNALESLTAALLVGRFASKPFRFATIQQVLTFVAAAAGIAPMVSATVIATADAIRGRHLFTTAWPLVWLGDATGVLASAPLTFVIVQAWRGRGSFPKAKMLEAAGVLAAMLIVGTLGFLGHLPSVYLAVPFMLWVSTRFHLRGAAVSIALLTILTGAFTANGYGPFVGTAASATGGVVRFQVFLAVSAVSALLVAVLSQQRLRAILQLEAANRELELRVEQRTGDLIASEARLRVATTGARVGTWEHDIAAGRGRWSPEAAELFGLGHTTLNSEDWLHGVHPDDRTALSEAWRRCVEHDIPYEAEFRAAAPAPDGGERWLLGRGSIERDGRSMPVRGVGVLLDITELRRIRDELLEQKDQLRLITDAMPALISYIGTDRRYRFVNVAYERWFGLKRDEAVGRSISEVLGRDAQEKVEDHVRRALSGERVRFDAAIDYQKAGRKWVEAHYLPDIDESGNVRGFFGLVLDITARKELEEKSRQQLEELENIYATVPVGLAVIDRDGRYVRVNERLAQANGIPAADHVGRTLREVVPSFGEKAEAVRRKVVETGEPVRDVILEGETLSQPGVRRAWSEIWTPVRNERDEVVAVSVVVDDVTERHWAETLFAEQNRLLEMIAKGRPLAEVLTEITGVIGRMEPSTRAAVLVADESRTYFEAAYAANIPRSYTGPLVGVTIEETPMGTCCKAVYGGEPVTSSNVADDTRWTEAWRRLCLEHGIKACHSEPIFGEGERALGTVVLGFDTPREPDERGLRMASFGAHVAGIAIERDRAEAALRKSENDYRTLFESMDEGYCVVEVEIDAGDRPVDFRFVQINPAFEKHSGLPQNAIGISALELVPGLEEHWLRTYGHVAMTGEAVRFENVAEPMGKWFDVYAVRVGDPSERRVGILFSDITARKRRAAHLEVLASVTNEFTRDLTVAEIVGTAGRKLADHLGVSDCMFAELDDRGETLRVHAAWAPPERRSLAGSYKVEHLLPPELAEAARRGETVVSGDTHAGSAGGGPYRIGAFVGVPFKRAGEWKYIFTVNSEGPREWLPDEVDLIREVTNRMFARVERARAEAELRVSEERLRLATEAAGIFTWEYDTSTGMSTYSPNVASVLGFELPDNTGDANLHIHPHDLERALGDFAACLEGVPVRSEYRYVNPKTGAHVWVSSQGTLIAGNGRPARAVGITQNITERKLAEESLQIAHDTFRHLVDTSPFGIYAVDADFKLARVSRGAQKVFEHVHPLLGRDFAEVLRSIWEEPFATEAIGIFRRTLETGEPFHSPRTIESRNDIDEIESYDWRVERITMPDGRSGVVCHFYDLSERLRYEAELRDAEERFRSVFEQAAVGIALLGPDGRWITVNERLCRILGYERDELVRHSFQEITHPDDLESDLENVRRTLAGETDSYAMNKRYIRRDGRLVWANLTVSLVREADGSPKYFISVVEDITERKRVEEALVESETRYRRLFETIDEGFCVIEFLDGPHGPLSDYVHIEANPAYTANAGIPNVVGQKVRSLVPEEADAWVETYRQVLVTGEPLRFERELVATGRHLELAAFRVEPAERRQVAVLFKDITARKSAEEALKAQTQLLRGITESTPDLIYAKDASGRMIMANKATLDTMGHTEETAIGRLDSDLYDPMEADLIMANDRRVMQSGRTETIEEAVTTPDGSRRTFLTTKNPLRSPDGRIVGVVGISHDITALKHAEKALRDSEERHRLALEAGAMGTWTWSMRGRECWADERTLALFGVDPAEWNGDVALLNARRHPEDNEAIDRSIAHAVAHRSTWRSEFRVVHAGGQTRWLAALGRLEFDYRGEPVRMRGISFDITERKQAEEELRSYHQLLEATVAERTRELAKTNKELQHENLQRRMIEKERQQLLGQLVAAQEEERRRIAQDLHDHLGQQLTALNLKLELALQNAVDGAAAHLHDAKAMMRRIDEDVDSLAWQLRPAILDDDGFLAAVKQYVEDWSHRYGVAADFWSDEHFERLGGLTPEAETNLYRITQEALNNVAKYASAARVEVILNRRGDSAVLTVQDDGAGFDVRSVTNGNAKSMGLIGMRERAGLVGGSFQIESAPGEGTTVFVRVPFASDDLDGRRAALS